MKFLRSLRSLFRKETLDAAMAEEMRAHVALQTERHIAAGMNPDEARYLAQREFGNTAVIQERVRDGRGWIWLEQTRQDVRYAVRSLVKSPSFTITAVLTLAFGIGVNAALFGLFDKVALQPLPVKDPDSLVQISGLTAQARSRPDFNHAEYLAYRDGNRTLDGLLACHDTKWSLQREAGAESDPAFDVQGMGNVSVVLVSDNYFSVLGATIQLGRDFLPDEVRAPGSAPVIVLSHLFWERYFHRDPAVLGATLKLGSEQLTVIGVAAVGFSGHSAVPPAGWVPLTMGFPKPAAYTPSGPEVFDLIGRLRPGISEAQAKADLDAIASRRAGEFPAEDAKTAVRFKRGMRFANIPLTPANLARLSPLFLGFGMVLIIACTNVANLLLARGVSRQAEIGVRLTLGAGRGRIMRQLLTENILLCLLGAGVGIGLGLGLLQVIKQIVLAPVLSASWLAFLTPVPDFRVLGFTVLLTVGATLVAGLLPAVHAARVNLIAAVHNEGTAFGRRITSSRLRQLLVILQVALCLALLSCAGVLARNLFDRQKPVLGGMDANGVFGVSIWPNPAIADRNLAFRQALETLGTLPDVGAVGVADGAPFPGRDNVTARVRTFEAATSVTDDALKGAFVTHGFFATFGVPVLRGRVFRALEQQAASRAIIVSESLARRLWPGQEAVGKTLAVSEAAWSPRRRPAPETAFRECEVIGVAGDVTVPFGDGDARLFYLPFALELPVRAPMYLRVRSDSAAARAGIVSAAQAKSVGLRFDTRVTDQIDHAALPYYCLTVVSGTLGALALAMASVGLYGLMTFAINQRVREIGIRMALGATAGKVVQLFVRQGMRLVAVGLGLGVVGGVLFALLLNAILYGFINAFDPVAFVAVTLLFAAIALFACWLPARRAAKVDPMVALRSE